MSYFHLFEEVHCRRDHDHCGDLVSELLLTGQPETDPASHGAAHQDIVVRAESVQDGSSSPQPVSQVYLPPGLSAHGER